MKCSLGISNFLEEISSLSHCIVFLYFFALITEEGFLISPCCSSELCFQMGIFPFLLCFLHLFFSQLFVRPPQTAILLFCISFPWGWSWSLSPVQCRVPPPYSLGTLALGTRPGCLEEAHEGTSQPRPSLQLAAHANLPTIWRSCLDEGASAPGSVDELSPTWECMSISNKW